MGLITRVFAIDRETKGTVRYKEEPQGPEVIGTIYVRKGTIPAGVKEITIIIEYKE